MFYIGLSIVMGLLPMLIYSTLLWWLDRWEKEPLYLVAAMFLWGFFPSACFALTSQLILEGPNSYLAQFSPQVAEFFSYSVIAPLTEEFIKGFALLLMFIMFYREFDSLLDGIVYGSLVGFGFAAIENILYFINLSIEDPKSLPFLIFFRAFVFGLNHAFYTSLTGIGFALVQLNNRSRWRWFFPVLGLCGALITHALHNYFAMMGSFAGLFLAVGTDWLGVLGVFIIFFASLLHEQKWIKHYLAEEVALGTLTAVQAAHAASFFTRLADSFVGWARGWGENSRTHRLYHLSAELAFKKHQLQRIGSEPKLELRVQEIREQVRGLAQPINNTALHR